MTLATDCPATVAPTLLVIAMIDGYTPFFRRERASLAHAQVVLEALREAVLQGSVGLELVKQEVDSAIFCLRGSPDSSAFLLPMIVAKAQALFSERKREFLSLRTCFCDSCWQLEALTLKFVAHSGETVRVGRRIELTGPTVRLVRRMVKNCVPITDYLLVTDQVLGRLDAAVRAKAIPIDHDFEGVGPTATYYIPVVAEPKAPAAFSIARKVLARLMLEVSALPGRLGWTRLDPRAGRSASTGKVMEEKARGAAPAPP